MERHHYDMKSAPTEYPSNIHQEAPGEQVAIGHCWFCDPFRFFLNSECGLPDKKSVVYEDRHFYITPDIAPILSGHLLLISKQHYRSLLNAPIEIKDRLQYLKKRIREFNLVEYKTPTIFFEHGTTSINLGSGPCVDHLHIHSLPFTKPIAQYIALQLSEIDFSMVRISGKLSLRSFVDYLYIDDADRKEFMISSIKIPSQLIRLAVSALIGRPKEKWQISYGNRYSINKFLETLNRYERF